MRRAVWRLFCRMMIMPNLHEEDTLVAGAGLCDEKAVETLVTEGTKYIKQLIEWGTEFDREGGKLVFTQEAAHSRRRILHAHGDSTGKEIVRALIARARAGKNDYSDAVCEYRKSDRERTEDASVSGFSIRFLRAPREIFAKAVIMCTGGAGQLYLAYDKSVRRDRRRNGDGLFCRCGNG